MEAGLDIDALLDELEADEPVHEVPSAGYRSNSATRPQDTPTILSKGCKRTLSTPEGVTSASLWCDRSSVRLTAPLHHEELDAINDADMDEFLSCSPNEQGAGNADSGCSGSDNDIRTTRGLDQADSDSSLSNDSFLTRPVALASRQGKSFSANTRPVSLPLGMDDGTESNASLTPTNPALVGSRSTSVGGAFAYTSGSPMDHDGLSPPTYEESMAQASDVYSLRTSQNDESIKGRFNLRIDNLRDTSSSTHLTPTLAAFDMSDSPFPGPSVETPSSVPQNDFFSFEEEEHVVVEASHPPKQRPNSLVLGSDTSRVAPARRPHSLSEIVFPTKPASPSSISNASSEIQLPSMPHDTLPTHDSLDSFTIERGDNFDVDLLHPFELSSTEVSPAVSSPLNFCDATTMSAEADPSLDDHDAEAESSGSTVIDETLGRVKPKWMADSEANACLQCYTPFTFVRRRHHCRACGRVFCDLCCQLKFRLPYTEREERVCVVCYQELVRLGSRDKLGAPLAPTPGVLKRPNISKRTSNRVTFSDGSNPGTSPGQVTESGELSSSPKAFMSTLADCCYIQPFSWDPWLVRLTEENATPLRVALDTHLHVLISLVKLPCCYEPDIYLWLVVSDGLVPHGSPEVVFLLRADPNSPPEQIFEMVLGIREESQVGRPLVDQSLVLWPHDTLLDANDNAGFLFFRRSYQCVSGFDTPKNPLFGILVKREELPWARQLPIRLATRLGSQMKHYPFPLVSDPKREALYSGLGHTILGVLCDFANYKYGLTHITGASLTLDQATQRHTLQLPRVPAAVIDRWLSGSEHVASLRLDFSEEADSHLVCRQNEDHYVTEAISARETSKKLVGASFVVFNGTFKARGGVNAKCSLIEDGLMVSIEADTFATFQQSLRALSDVSIEAADGATLIVKWVDLVPTQISSCDGEPIYFPLHRFPSPLVFPTGAVTFHCAGCYTALMPPQFRRKLLRLCSALIQPFAIAMSRVAPMFLERSLYQNLGFRVTISSDCVSYDVGCGGSPLSPELRGCLSSLDDNFMPIVNALLSKEPRLALNIELPIFLLHDSAE